MVTDRSVALQLMICFSSEAQVVEHRKQAGCPPCTSVTGELLEINRFVNSGWRKSWGLLSWRAHQVVQGISHQPNHAKPITANQAVQGLGFKVDPRATADLQF